MTKNWLMRVTLICCGWLLVPCALIGVAIAQPDSDKLLEIEPQQGLEHVGKSVRVRMLVTSIGGFGDGEVLNSAKEWNVAGNFQIILPGKMVAEYRSKGIEKPNLHFWNKVVEVTGLVEEIRPGGMRVPAIKIESQDQLKFVLVSTRQTPKLNELRDRRVDIYMKSNQFMADVLVTEIETKGDPIGIVSLKVRSAAAPPKPVAPASIDEIYVEDIPLDLTYDRKSRLLIVDEKQRASRLKQSAEIEQRVLKRGGKFWEYLSPTEQADRVAQGKEFVAESQKLLPQLRVTETKYYLLMTDLDQVSAQQYLKYLDTLYDEMCRSFVVPQGKNIWAGKCIVATFQKQSDYLKFELEMMKNKSNPEKSQGLCHAQNDGQVVISAWKGDLTNHFAGALVHETSHGFVARYRSNLRAPSWLNEGMADWISNRIVKGDLTKARQARSVQLIQQQRSLAGLFDADQISPDHYGVAFQLVDILLEIDAAKFRRFFVGIKEGLNEEDSLQQAYQLTHHDLARLYGRKIGIVDLKPQ